jgi:hypothetical protein
MVVRSQALKVFMTSRLCNWQATRRSYGIAFAQRSGRIMEAKTRATLTTVGRTNESGEQDAYSPLCGGVALEGE